MSTKMNEADWELALDVFRACLPARGAKAKDDRLFLEPCTTSPSTTSRGEHCRNGSVTGTLFGSGSIGLARRACLKTTSRCWRG